MAFRYGTNVGYLLPIRCDWITGRFWDTPLTPDMLEKMLVTGGVTASPAVLLGFGSGSAESKIQN